MTNQLVSLGELLVDAELFTDGDWVESKDQDKLGSHRLIQLADIGDGYFLNKSARFMNEAAFNRLRCTELKRGDLLIARMPEPLGRACIFPGDLKICATVVDVCIIRPNENRVNVRWLQHALNSPLVRAQIKSLSRGATRIRISRKDLSAILIPYSPLEEQKRIATILDKAAEIKAKREQAIAKLDALTSSTFTELFLKDGKWPTLKLMEVCTTTSGGTPKRDVADYYGGEILWVKSGELAADLVMNTEETLTFEGVKNSSAKVMPPKTVLLAMYGATIGAVSMLGISAATNQAICCITVGEKLLPEFLVYYLKSIKHNLIKLAVGGAQPNINQDIIRNLLVPIPPASLQQMFLERATAIRQQIIKAEMSLSQIKTAIASLQHQAFTSGFNA